MGGWVDEFEGFEIGHRRFPPKEVGKLIAGQAALDCLEPRGEVWVLAARIVFQAVGVAEEDSRHRAEVGVIVFLGSGPHGARSMARVRRCRHRILPLARKRRYGCLGAIDIDIRRNEDIFWKHSLR